MKNNNLDYELNSYGFRWGEMFIERTASTSKPRYGQVLRIYCPNGDLIEIQASKRKTYTSIEKRKKK